MGTGLSDWLEQVVQQAATQGTSTSKPYRVKLQATQGTQPVVIDPLTAISPGVPGGYYQVMLREFQRVVNGQPAASRVSLPTSENIEILRRWADEQ